jgi:peptidyl-prolyl cis-trans isomerase B (cyclophilin B)
MTTTAWFEGLALTSVSRQALVRELLIFVRILKSVGRSLSLLVSRTTQKPQQIEEYLNFVVSRYRDVGWRRDFVDYLKLQYQHTRLSRVQKNVSLVFIRHKLSSAILIVRCGLKAIIAFLLLLSLSTSQAAATPPPFVLPSTKDLKKLRKATIETTQGTMLFSLYPETAPWHVANFKYRADKGLFRDIPIQSFTKGYILQSDARKMKGSITALYQIPPEFSSLVHRFGTLGMARRSDEINRGRNSDCCRFHVLLGPAAHLDGLYTIFGQLESGEAILRALTSEDVIKDVKVYVRQ